jgi:signal transduction histidine kinase
MALVLGLTAVAWLVGGLVMVRAWQDGETRLRDRRLEQLSSTVLAFARHELAESGFAPGPAGADEPPTGVDLRYRYQVWRLGHLLLHSPDASTVEPLAGGQMVGFHNRLLDGRPARIHVSEPDSAALQVQVAELRDQEDLARSLPGVRVVAMALVSLLVVALASGWLLVRALRPVEAAEAALRQRPAHALEPMPLDGLPDEMLPLLSRLNDHLAGAAGRLSRESGFTALAAHELRTPLAALRMQVQVAMRAAEPAARDAQLAAVLGSVDRTGHLIDQLLTLARIDQASAGTAEAVELRALSVEVATQLGPEQRVRGTTIAVSGPDVFVKGWAFGLQVMLRNLLDNALAHGPPGAAIALTLSDAHEGVVLTVDDAGPGIAPEDRTRVFERFVRLDQSGRTPGSGLGLSIVRAVADAVGARVELLDSPLGGLRVRVLFPAVAVRDGSPAPAP